MLDGGGECWLGHRVRTLVQCVEEADHLEEGSAFLHDAKWAGQITHVSTRMLEHLGLGGVQVVATEMVAPSPSQIEKSPVQLVVEPRGIGNAISFAQHCVRKKTEE